ncbi:MAG: DUF6502 family protein [Pseudomonadota bacterium]
MGYISHYYYVNSTTHSEKTRKLATNSQTESNDADVKQGLLAAYRRFMGPLVRILIRNGISFDEFADELKGVFVEIAHDDFPIDGRNPSGTRIAILTGLTRKEVKRQLERLESGEQNSSGDPNRVMRVLNGWHVDPEFTGPYGLPHELYFDSPQGKTPSFSELVRRYSGDMSPRAMLDELLRSEAVEELPDKTLRALTRTHVTSRLDPQFVARLATIIGSLAETLDHNLMSETTNEPKRFERNVFTEIGVNTKVLDDFNLLMRDKGQRFIETIEQFLTANEGVDLDEQNKAEIKVGVEVYMYIEKE